MKILDNKDFKKYLKNKDRELYEGIFPSLLLFRTKSHFSRILYKGNFLYIKGITTIMRDLYQVEQDFINNIDDCI